MSVASVTNMRYALKIFGAAAAIFPGAGAGRASLVSCSKTIVNKLLRDIIVIRIAFPIDWQCFRVCDIEQSWSKNNCLFAPSRAHKKANIWGIFLEKLINFHSVLILCNLNLRKLPKTIALRNSDLRQIEDDGVEDHWNNETAGWKLLPG